MFNSEKLAVWQEAINFADSRRQNLIKEAAYQKPDAATERQGCVLNGLRKSLQAGPA